MQTHTTKAEGAKVYIVDDDAAFRASLGWLLESVGAALELCSSAEQFLAVYDPDQVMAMVVRGEANKVIAFELALSEKTIEVHRARVMHKLNVASLAELVRFDVSATSAHFPHPPMVDWARPGGMAAFAA